MKVYDLKFAEPGYDCRSNVSAGERMSCKENVLFSVEEHESGMRNAWDGWWEQADFQTLERITGFRQVEFDPDDGYQGFVDACDSWWKELDEESKKEFGKSMRFR